MKKIAVIGHFAFGKEYLDGQTVKTKVLSGALCEQFGEDAVLKVDTHGWSGNPIRFFSRVWQTTKRAENVIILPAHNGLRVIVPLLYTAVKLHKKCRLHYAVIGGWLPKYLKNKNKLAKQLKTFVGIYVETSTMKNALQDVGFQNVVVMPNCKNLQILEPSRLPNPQKPYKLCTFSRVMREKGIEDAIGAVKAVNETQGEMIYTLDIYGPVDPTQTQWFDELQKTFPSYIRYGGAVPFDKSVEVLKDYFALLFPTYYDGEGFAGTLLDAMASGVPVVASNWRYNAEIVKEGETGLLFPARDVDALTEKLKTIVVDTEKWNTMRTTCLQEAQKYLPEEVVKVLLERIEA